MTDLENKAIEFADKIFKQSAQKELKAINKQLEKDFIEQVVFGIGVGYRIDKEGKITRLTDQEFLEMQNDSPGKELSVAEIIKRFGG